MVAPEGSSARLALAAILVHSDLRAGDGFRRIQMRLIFVFAIVGVLIFAAGKTIAQASPEQRNNPTAPSAMKPLEGADCKRFRKGVEAELINTLPDASAKYTWDFSNSDRALYVLDGPGFSTWIWCTPKGNIEQVLLDQTYPDADSYIYDKNKNKFLVDKKYIDKVWTTFVTYSICSIEPNEHDCSDKIKSILDEFTVGKKTLLIKSTSVDLEHIPASKPEIRHMFLRPCSLTSSCQ